MRSTAIVQEVSNGIGIQSPVRNHRLMIQNGDLIVDLERRIVTANRPILYCAISIPYDIISKFWPIWSDGPRRGLPEDAEGSRRRPSPWWRESGVGYLSRGIEIPL